MTTKLKLYNKALGFLGAQRLHSTTGLTETVEARYLLDAVYDDALQSCLELGNWKFALRSAQVTPDPDIDTSWGREYAYSQPSDFVRLAGFATDEYFKNEVSDYIEEAGYWYTDISQVYMRWVSNGTSYGLNLGSYPENYARVVACHMAIESGIAITKSRGDRNDLIGEFQNIILPRAKRLDALDEPIKYKPAGSWAASRTSSRSRVHIRDGKIRWGS